MRDFVYEKYNRKHYRGNQMIRNLLRKDNDPVAVYWRDGGKKFVANVRLRSRGDQHVA